MCYTTTTHFSHCSHRISTTTLCPRAIQQRPTVYHPHPSYTRPCVTSGREGGVFVCRDRLCDACHRVNFWFAGGGGGGRSDKSTRRDQSEGRRKNKGPAVRTTGGSPYHDPLFTRGRSVPRPVPAKSMYPVPTAAQGGGRCPLSEAFERAVRIGGGDGDAPITGSQVFSGGENEGEGTGCSRIRKQKGEYGPFKPPRFSPVAGDSSGDYGGYAARKTECKKKQVRFAPEIEMLYFRGYWVTRRTLRSLDGEFRGRR